MGNGSALAEVLAWPNNLLSLARIVLVTSLIGLMFAGVSIPVWIGVSVFVVGYWFLDQIDGMVARRLNKGSSFGESLDLAADRWCDVLAAAYLLQAAPQHGVALIAFLLLRIAPEVCISRYMGTKSAMFIAAAGLDPPSWLTPRWSARLMETAFILKTGFFAWALFGEAPAWAGAALVIPSALFMVLVLRVMARHAADVLAARAGHD